MRLINYFMIATFFAAVVVACIAAIIKQDVVVNCALAVIAFHGVAAVAVRMFNRWLGSWVCEIYGLHIKPKEMKLNADVLHGDCPRCGKHVMFDFDGEWH